MFCELINEVAKQEQGPQQPYRPRPSLAGPERCLRQLVYMACGYPATPFPGRTILTFSDGKWHEELTADWMRKTIYQIHSEQMPINLLAPDAGDPNQTFYCHDCKQEIPGGRIHGHIDWIARSPLGKEWLVEHKSANRFACDRMERGEFPEDYFTQTALCSAGIQTELAGITDISLIIKNKDTAIYLEYEMSYNLNEDCLYIHKFIKSKGDMPAEITELNERRPDIVRNAIDKFTQVENYKRDKILPARPYEFGTTFPCDYCIDPKTNILMADFSWKQAYLVKPGERIWAFSENPVGRDRRVEIGIIEAKRSVNKDAIKITTLEGVVVCSLDHKWLSKHKYSEVKWIFSKDLKVGSEIFRFANPSNTIDLNEHYKLGYIQGLIDGEGTKRLKGGWVNIRVAMCDKEPLDRLQSYLKDFGIESKRGPFITQGKRPMEKVYVCGVNELNETLEMLEIPIKNKSHAAGYLASIFDGEGTLNVKKWQSTFRLNNTNPIILDKIIKASEYLNLPFKIEPNGRKSKENYKTVYGVRPYTKHFTTTVMTILSLIRPAIIEKRERLQGARLYNSWDKIIKIENLGSQELIDFQTSTRTFIADGLASHNCRYGQTCWQNYVQELVALPANAELAQDIETAAKYFLQKSAEISESNKEVKEIKAQIKGALKALNVSGGRAGSVSVQLKIVDRKGYKVEASSYEQLDIKDLNNS